MSRGDPRGPRPASLAGLFHHRWAVPLLAELHGRGGAKFVTLLNRLGVGRDSLQRTLAGLIRSGHLRHNPGHGHPMRPEYLLTAKGARLAPGCAVLMAALGTPSLRRVVLKKWAVPLLAALRPGRCRFSDLRSALPGATARALALALNDLIRAELVERVDTGPEGRRAGYALTPDGRHLAGLVDRFPGPL